MKLRSRQELFVERCINNIKEYGNTLGVAPTGAGKTVMLSHIIKRLAKDKIIKKTLVIVHRIELLNQNEAKFKKISTRKTSKYSGRYKKKDRDISGSVVFATIQSLYSAFKTGKISLSLFDFIVIDEVHHITSMTYIAILNDIVRDKKINEVKLLGVTATPERKDSLSVGNVFTNIADVITIAEQIKEGFLVPAKAYCVTGQHHDVIKIWRKTADNRQTIVFCDTILHAMSVYQTFKNANIKAGYIDSKNVSIEDREIILNDFATQKIQVIVNVRILTEGFDCPIVSCIVLMTNNSYKSTVLQMVGRGLRIINKKQYPNIIKKDCVILDFGNSTRNNNINDNTINISEIKKKNYQNVIDNMFSMNYYFEDNNLTKGLGNNPYPDGGRYCGEIFLPDVADEKVEIPQELVPDISDETKERIAKRKATIAETIKEHEKLLQRELGKKEKEVIELKIYIEEGIFYLSYFEYDFYIYTNYYDDITCYIVLNNETYILIVGEKYTEYEIIFTSNDFDNCKNELINYVYENVEYNKKIICSILKWLDDDITDSQSKVLAKYYKYDTSDIKNKYHASCAISLNYDFEKKILPLLVSNDIDDENSVQLSNIFDLAFKD